MYNTKVIKIVSFILLCAFFTQSCVYADNTLAPHSIFAASSPNENSKDFKKSVLSDMKLLTTVFSIGGHCLIDNRKLRTIPRTIRKEFAKNPSFYEGIDLEGVRRTDNVVYIDYTRPADGRQYLIKIFPKDLFKGESKIWALSERLEIQVMPVDVDKTGTATVQTKTWQEAVAEINPELIVFDLDGTIAEQYGEVSDSICHNIKRLREKHKKILVVTGSRWEGGIRKGTTLPTLEERFWGKIRPELRSGILIFSDMCDLRGFTPSGEPRLIKSFPMNEELKAKIRGIDERVIATYGRGAGLEIFDKRGGMTIHLPQGDIAFAEKLAVEIDKEITAKNLPVFTFGTYSIVENTQVSKAKIIEIARSHFGIDESSDILVFADALNRWGIDLSMAQVLGATTIYAGKDKIKLPTNTYSAPKPGPEGANIVLDYFVTTDTLAEPLIGHGFTKEEVNDISLTLWSESEAFSKILDELESVIRARAPDDKLRESLLATIENFKNGKEGRQLGVTPPRYVNSKRYYLGFGTSKKLALANEFLDPANPLSKYAVQALFHELYHAAKDAFHEDRDIEANARAHLEAMRLAALLFWGLDAEEVKSATLKTLESHPKNEFGEAIRAWKKIREERVSSAVSWVSQNVPELEGKSLVTLSMEGNIPEFKGTPAQDANTRGGLGAYYGDKFEGLDHIGGIDASGMQPGYLNGPNGEVIDYDELVERGILEHVNLGEGISVWSWIEDPVLKDLIEKGDKRWILRVISGNVELRVKAYRIKRDGAKRYLLVCPVFDTLYADSRTHRFTQETVFGKAVYQFLKRMRLVPDILHLNEGHTVVAAAEIRTDPYFDKTAIVLTDHTPMEVGHEMFYPMPGADINRMTYVIGAGGDKFRSQFLRKKDGMWIADFSFAAIELADVINSVSDENRMVLKRLFEKIYKEKTGYKVDLEIVPVLNGVGDEWVALKLLEFQRAGRIPTEEELWQIHEDSKENEAFEEVYRRTGVRLDPAKPTAWAVRRLVDYKSQYPILRFIVHLMCADRETTFTKDRLREIWNSEILPFLGDTEQRKRQYNRDLDSEMEAMLKSIFRGRALINGLGMQFVVGGPNFEPFWVEEFRRWASLPELKGRFVYVPDSNAKLLKMQSIGSDICINMPRPLDEACGTSDDRSGRNGGVNIAPRGAGPIEWITNYNTKTKDGSGFLIGSYTRRDSNGRQAQLSRFYMRAPCDILRKCEIASGLFYKEDKSEWKHLMHNSYMASTYGEYTARDGSKVKKKAVTARAMEERYARDVYPLAIKRRKDFLRPQEAVKGTAAAGLRVFFDKYGTSPATLEEFRKYRIKDTKTGERFSESTVRRELDALRKLGILEVTIEKGKYLYRVSARLRNLIPSAELKELIGELAQLPELDYSSLSGENFNRVKAKAKMLVEARINESLLEMDGDISTLHTASKFQLEGYADIARPRNKDGNPGDLLKLDLKEGERVIVVGDLHGRADNLGMLLARQDIIEGLEKGRLHLIFLGDYPFYSKDYLGLLSEDRKREMLSSIGENGFKILSLLAELKTAYPAKVHLLAGNSELTFVDYFDKNFEDYKNGKEIPEKMKPFFDYVSAKYGVDTLQYAYDFFESMPMFAEVKIGDKAYLISHGGFVGLEDMQNHINWRAKRVWKKLSGEFDNTIYNAVGKEKPDETTDKLKALKEYLENLGVACLITGHTHPSDTDYIKLQRYGLKRIADSAAQTEDGNMVVIDSMSDIPAYLDISASETMAVRAAHTPLDMLRDENGEAAIKATFSKKAVVENPLTGLKNKNVMNFVESSLGFSYSRYANLPRHIPVYILKILNENRGKLEETVKAIRNLNGFNNFRRAYTQYKAEDKIQHAMKFIRGYVEEMGPGITVVDVGCGNNSLGLGILGRIPNIGRIGNVKKVVGVDPERLNFKNDSEIEFRLQTDNYRIPCKNGEGDVVLLMGMAHYLEDEEGLQLFLMEINRILKPGGIAIVLEDSYSDKEQVQFDNNRLALMFEKLTEIEKYMAMALIEWIGGKLIPEVMGKGLTDYKKPYNFKTIEEWVKLFTHAGMLKNDTRYLGFPKGRLHLNPQSLLVFEKTRYDVGVNVTPDESYRVKMSFGIFNEGNGLLAEEIGNKKAFFVVDKGIGDELIAKIQAYVKHYGIVAKVVVMEGGEQVKDGVATAFEVTKKAEEFGIDRKEIMVLVGGGAVLDMAGFAASILHRGIEHIRIPTTLLSQIDAGIGTKNAVNFLGQKNLLGVFQPPKIVLIDPTILSTLDSRQMRSGLAEAIKVSLIKDRDFFNYIKDNFKSVLNKEFSPASPAEHIMWQTIKLHLSQIRRDPYEMKLARPLDFGHEWGHRMEIMTGHRLTHGEAVSVGMAIDSVISYNRGYIAKDELEEILALFEEVGLPIYDNAASDTEELWPGLENFRRHLGGELTISLLKGIGDKQDVNVIEKSELISAVEYLRLRVMNPEEDMAAIHNINIGLIPNIPKGKVLWHVMPIGLIPFEDYDSRADFLRRIREMNKHYTEKIRFVLESEDLASVVNHLQADSNNVIDVALDSDKYIDKLPDDIAMLIFEPKDGQLGNLRQLEGIIASLKALHIEDYKEKIDVLTRLHKILTGQAPVLIPEATDSLKEFARKFKFILPPIEIKDKEELRRLRDNTLKFIESA